VELTNGFKFWYIAGEVHRMDGPAVVMANDRHMWYIKNKRVSKSEVTTQVSQMGLKTLLLTRTVNPFCEVKVPKYTW